MRPQRQHLKTSEDFSGDGSPQSDAASGHLRATLTRPHSSLSQMLRTVRPALAEEGVIPLWPKGVAVIGMRGATSWKRFLKYYQWPDGSEGQGEKPTAFAFTDRDNAGREWFAKDGFIDQLSARCVRVWGFWPTLTGAKDFNDVHKARGITKEQLRAMLVSKLRRNAAKKKITFLKWCREQAGKRADEIGKAAFLVVRDKERPRGRKSLPVWERHWARAADAADLPVLRQAWAEWMKA